MTSTRMRHVRLLLLALLTALALLAGCATQTAPESEPTDASADRSREPRPTDKQASRQPRREQAIAAYDDYLERYPAAPERLRIERRLADLLLDSANELAVAAESAADDSQRTATAIREQLARAIGLYEGLLRQDAHAAQDAELLYQLARAHEESAQPQRAMVIFERLIADKVGVDQRLYADVQFRRGEILFGQGNYPGAERAYRAVVGLGEAVPLFEQALYKLGWSTFKQARYADAVPVFFALLDRKAPATGSFDAHMATLTRADREQVNDVLRGISLCFSYLTGADAIAEYFKRHGERSYAAQIYRDLAELYETKELYTDAAMTYLALARRAPLDGRAPHLTLEAIRLYRRAGLANKVLETQAALVSNYGPTQAFWQHSSRQPAPAVRTALQESLVDLASHHHRLAEGSPGAVDFREAERWYRTYLAWFDDTAQADEMHYRLAELLFEHGEYPAAATEFERIAYERAGHPQAAEAALSALVAHEKSADRGNAANAPDGPSTKSRSALRFVETYSIHPEAAVVFRRAAVELLEHGQTQTAIRVSDALLQTSKPTARPLRQAAWSVLAQARYTEGDYAEAEAAYREALRLTGRGDARRTELAKGLAATLYRQAQGRRARGEEGPSAAVFLRAARAAPGTPVAITAEYDAASALLAAQQWDQAIEVLERFRAAHPGHPLQAEAAKKLAFAYRSRGRYIDAAVVYRTLGTGEGDEALRRAALWSAAELYREGGDLPGAIQVLARYVKEFPRPAAEAIEAYHTLAELEGVEGDAGQRRHWLRKVIEVDRSAGAARNARMRTLAAQGTLDLAMDEIEAFRRIPLIEPLQDSLRRKLQAMQQAQKRLEAASQYQIAPVNSAATYHIANLYRELSEAMRASERPAGLNRDELAQYERQLEQQAVGFEHKAVEIYQRHTQRVSADRHDQWTELSLKRLDELEPSQPMGDAQHDSAQATPD